MGVQRQYEKSGVEDIGAYIAEQALQDQKARRIPFDVVALPSNEISFEGEEKPPQHACEYFVVSLAIRERDTLEALARGIARNEAAFFGGGADVPFAGMEHWCPIEAPTFSNRAAAERLLEVPYVRDEKNLTGKNVNVVIVDQGLDAAALGANYAGGWSVGKIRPGTTKPQPGSDSRTHGMMIAQNILAVAPDARIFDLPLVPWKILDIPAFLSVANSAFWTMRAAIANFKANPRFRGPWIIVNPWGIYDSRMDLRPPHDYINNPNHPFNKLVEAVVGDGHDVIFAAGNCGQFCPDERCGEQDYGPGRSILGANSLGPVLTIGAVRTDTVWLGYSSQGPGQSRLAHDKPDLCAPSQFCETGDAFTTNSGTSAACAVAAGVIAGLRSKRTAAAVTPPQLKSVLIKTAMKVDGQRWNGRRGNGILNAKAAYNAIP